MPAEAFSWNEAQIALFTGNAAPVTSAVFAYAESLNGTFADGWENRVKLGGRYDNHLTGQRADVTIAAMFTYSMQIQRMVAARTAIHMKLYHSSVNGSAGYILYSGRVDSLALAGGDGQVFKYTLQYHANSWSAFGGA